MRLTNIIICLHGVNYNPFHERFFDGVSFRVYSFEHKFMPEDEVESLQVSRLIKRFQFYSLPNLIANRLFMTYPSLWRIGFFESDCNRNQFLPVLEDCVITLVGVVYGGGGSWQDLVDGAPIETTLSLQVTETTIPTKQRMMIEERAYGVGSEGVREKLDIGGRKEGLMDRGIRGGRGRSGHEAYGNNYEQIIRKNMFGVGTNIYRKL